MASSERDPFELLRDANPVDEAALPATVDHLPAQRILAALGTRGSARRHPRRIAWAVAATIVALVLAGAAIVVARRGSNTITIDCFAQPSRNGALAVVAPSAPTAVETCAQAWRDGRLGQSQEPPPLVGCVLETGVVGVFPSDDPGLCDRLGLPRHDPTQRFDLEPAAILARRLSDFYRAAGCPDAAVTESFIRQQFAELALDNWRIQAPSSPPRPGLCTTGVVDSRRRMVTLAPAPPTPGLTTTSI